MNCGEEVSSEFIVAGGYTPEIFESAEAALDDVTSSVSALVEAVQGNPVGFVGNDRSRADAEHKRTKRIAIIAFVGEQRAHRRRERQYIGRGGDVGVLAWRQMDGVGPAKRIAQRVDFCGASAA